MRIGWFLSGTHVTAAVIGGAACLVATQFGTIGLALAPVAILLALGIALVVARRLQTALHCVEKVAAGGDEFADTSTGVWDVDQLAERIRQFSHRWAEAANSSRRESREVQQLLEEIDRRAVRDSADRRESVALRMRRLLGNTVVSTDENLQEIIGHGRQAEQAAQLISSGSDEQREALSKTTTFVEQLSADFDAVSQNASVAQRSAGEARELSVTAGRTLDELEKDTGRLRLYAETAERKLRALGERSHEIGSIVQMIGAISSRTDLLALNASIESYRGGEQGRGFSVVAEEVRKLAEQTAQATREVTTLIESIQLEAQESILAMAEQRAHVEAGADQVRAAGEQLTRVSDACSLSSQHIDDILRAAGHQLRLTQDLVANVETLSDGARNHRKRAEEIGWTLRTVTDVVRKVGSGLTPLRRCSDRDTSKRMETMTDSTDADRDAAPVADEVQNAPALTSVDEAMSLVNDSLETE
ncbi:MAG: hypothetical protein HON53_10950 [Planctomycetaceae bacterium]|nr:hypothetical protein [Planctomycetaceae bacterium]MBT6154037.1 hypothetical protein [Planctomycetaceae bacterium]MBT6485093.1 hypothetical protein [Planctomycetaceae bacterium]MBT6495906.1 hypothetical protein [Planctomycetaceae bacterium]